MAGVDSTIALAALGVVAAVFLAAVFLGRRIDLRFGNIHAELSPNGGKSFRDEMDKRFDKIDGRLDKLEKAAAPAATVVVNPPPPSLRQVRHDD